jgi:hypothetical protein
MARYIDADELNDEYYELFHHGTMAVKRALPVFVDLLDKQPAADVVEVKHGEWIVAEECKTPLSHGYIRTEKTYICPFCTHHFRKKMKFCGECGAKMDGERK